VEAIPWPFSPPMPIAKSILFITTEPVFAVERVNLRGSEPNKQAGDS
jgi:hypothetical protein